MVSSSNHEVREPGRPEIRRTLLPLLLLIGLALPQPALAIDPPYEAEMEHLAETMGSLYFLDPLCKRSGADWRQQANDLITLDKPDDDRRQRLFGAFNSGYDAYARLYRVCTISASEALDQLLIEAEKTARDISSRYSE